MRWQARVRHLVDLVVVIVTVAALRDGFVSDGLLHPVDVVLTGAWGAALLARHRWPWSPALVPAVVAAHAAALLAWPNESGMTVAALILSAVLFGAGMPSARALAAAPLWPGAVGALMLLTDYGESGLSDLWYPGMFMLVALGGGMVVGRASSGRRSASARVEDVERALAERRAGIIAAERSRIAQDLRALVADEIGGIRDRAAATRELLAQGDTAAAEQALKDIEDAGSETLADLRQMLGVLRRDMTEDAPRPMPGLGALDGIARRAEQEGVTVTIDVRGGPTQLPHGVEVVLYRVVDRVLTQACRARVPQVAVVVRHLPGAVEVRVRAAGLGQLLAVDRLAIRERVTVYGGDLVIGTDGEDHDILQVRLPLPAERSDPAPTAGSPA